LIPIDITKEQIGTPGKNYWIKRLLLKPSSSPAWISPIISLPGQPGLHDKKSIRVLLNFEEDNF